MKTTFAIRGPVTTGLFSLVAFNLSDADFSRFQFPLTVKHPPFGEAASEKHGGLKV